MTLRVGLLFGALCLAGCGQRGPPSSAGAATAAATLVVTAPVALQTLGAGIEAVGTTWANESASITSKTSNIVAAIHFREGDRVQRGDLLIELDAAEARAALAEAEAARLDSENQFRRSQNLYTRQALSASQLEQLEANLKADAARVDVAKARLADTAIRAGFSGRVGMRRVSVGSLVGPGVQITTLDDTSVIKLEFTVPEIFLNQIRVGQLIAASTPAIPERTFNGRITVLGSRVDATTRSITVRAEIPNASGPLLPGMFMNVHVDGEPSPAMMVPEAAIIPEQGHTFLFAVIDGAARRREVQIGRRRPGEVEIVQGVAPGERVVVEGTQMLRDGDTVREDPAADTAAAPEA